MAGGKIPDVTSDKESDSENVITKHLLKIFSFGKENGMKFV